MQGNLGKPARLGGMSKRQLLAMKPGSVHLLDFSSAWGAAKLHAMESHRNSIKARVSKLKREGHGHWKVRTLYRKQGPAEKLFAFCVERVA